MSGESVDVRFDDTGLTITGYGNDPRTVRTVPYPAWWELTRQEFSRLPNVRNTAAE